MLVLSWRRGWLICMDSKGRLEEVFCWGVPWRYLELSNIWIFWDKISCMSQWSSTFKVNKAQQVAISSGEMHWRGMNSKLNLRCFDLNMKSLLAIYRCSDCMQCISLHSLGFHHVTICNVDLFADFATSYAPTLTYPQPESAVTQLW